MKQFQPRLRATKIATAFLVLGLLAQGCAAVEDRRLGQVATDAEIRLDINKRVLNGQNQDLFFDLKTNVYEGRVMLTGAVKSAANRTRIENLAKGIPGVRTIYNNVQVTDAGGFKNTANDVWIKTKINSQLLAENGVNSANYQTRVVNSVVYIIGRALSQHELGKVLTIAKRTDHVSKVVHHIEVRR
ncbi:MAG: BON domain-containing protein [Alphaproteobacteria bacterium]